MAKSEPGRAGDLPPLAEFLRWLNEMPPAFRGVPEGFPGGRTPVHAVVADLYDTLYGTPAADELLQAFRPANTGKGERNRLLWVMAACHLLWHPALRTRALPAEGLRKLLVQNLAALAAVTPADRLLDDEERREELVRRALRALDLRLPGESVKEAQDRLAQVDSVERQRLLRAAAEKEKRAREVREMMARRAAEEAAAKVSRE
jgi:hypothetical protein